jgi:hypothetical protein
MLNEGNDILLGGLAMDCGERLRIRDGLNCTVSFSPSQEFDFSMPVQDRSIGQSRRIVGAASRTGRECSVETQQAPS